MLSFTETLSPYTAPVTPDMAFSAVKVLVGWPIFLISLPQRKERREGQRRIDHERNGKVRSDQDRTGQDRKEETERGKEKKRNIFSSFWKPSSYWSFGLSHSDPVNGTEWFSRTVIS